MKKLVVCFLTLILAICIQFLQFNDSAFAVDVDDLHVGLQGYWPLDGDANDYSGNGKDGVNNGGNFESAIVGNGLRVLSYEPDEEHVSVAHDAQWDLSGDFSIGFWVKLDEQFDGVSFIGKGEGGGSTYKWMIYHHNDRFVFHTNTEDNDVVNFSSLGRKTLYFKFRNTQNHVSEVVLKNVNLIKNGGEILHESAPELEFSKLSMNERVRANLEARRAKRLEWLKERQNYEFKEIVIPYEVNNGSLSVNIKNVPIDFKFERFLQVGMRGDDILNLQKILQELGYFDFEEGPTGYFGEVTKKALIDFQIDNSLAPFPGTLGPKTRELLNNEYLYLLS
jgi:hypothetical protein